MRITLNNKNLSLKVISTLLWQNAMCQETHSHRVD